MTVREVYLEVSGGNLMLPINGTEKRLFSRESLKKAVGGRIVSENNKKYVQCLKDVNIRLESGDRLGLIGHNGAGKTSLLRALSGIYPIGSGEIKVSGKISTFISQGVGLSPDMNAVEYLEMQCVVQGYNKKETADFTAKVLDFIELGEFAYMPIRTYSSGMKARLMASTAIFFPCDILLIDEGIGAGDANFSEKFDKRLKEFFAAAKIMVMASHSNDLLKKWCNKGAVMAKGEILFLGEIGEAIAYYKSLQAPFFKKNKISVGN